MESEKCVALDDLRRSSSLLIDLKLIILPSQKFKDKYLSSI